MSDPTGDASRAEARRRLEAALQDRAVVELAVQRTPSLIVAAAFHAQQAAEKLVKVLLILAEQPLRKTHNIGRLLDELGPVPGLPDAVRDRLAQLTPWAAHTRYPDADPASLPGTGEIGDALLAIDQLASLVRAAIAPA